MKLIARLQDGSVAKFDSTVPEGYDHLHMIKMVQDLILEETKSAPTVVLSLVKPA